MAEILFSAWDADGQIPLESSDFDLPDYCEIPTLLEALESGEDVSDTLECLSHYAPSDMAERSDEWTRLLRGLSCYLTRLTPIKDAVAAFCFTERLTVVLAGENHPCCLDALIVILSCTTIAVEDIVTRSSRLLSSFLSSNALTASASEEKLYVLLSHISNGIITHPPRLKVKLQGDSQPWIYRLVASQRMRHHVLRVFHFTGVIADICDHLRSLTSSDIRVRPCEMAALEHWDRLSQQIDILGAVCAYSEGIDVATSTRGPIECSCISSAESKRDLAWRPAVVAAVPCDADPLINVIASPALRWNGRVQELTPIIDGCAGVLVDSECTDERLALSLRTCPQVRDIQQSLLQASASLLVLMVQASIAVSDLAPLARVADDHVAAVQLTLGKVAAAAHGRLLSQSFIKSPCQACHQAIHDAWRAAGQLLTLNPLAPSPFVICAQGYLYDLVETLGRGDAAFGALSLGKAFFASACADSQGLTVSEAQMNWLIGVETLGFNAYALMHAGNSSLQKVVLAHLRIIRSLARVCQTIQQDALCVVASVGRHCDAICGLVVSALRDVRSSSTCAWRPHLVFLALLGQIAAVGCVKVLGKTVDAPFCCAALDAFAPAIARLCAQTLSEEHLATEVPSLTFNDDLHVGAVLLPASECIDILAVMISCAGCAVVTAAADTLASHLLLAFRRAGIYSPWSASVVSCSSCDSSPMTTHQLENSLPWARGAVISTPGTFVDPTVLSEAIYERLRHLRRESGVPAVELESGPALGGAEVRALVSFIEAAFSVHPELTQLLLGVSCVESASAIDGESILADIRPASLLELSALLRMSATDQFDQLRGRSVTVACRPTDSLGLYALPVEQQTRDLFHSIAMFGLYCVSLPTLSRGTRTPPESL